jgi:co-chaperonin GroES (HSP10)
MQNFTPINRNVHVSVVEQEKEESKILLPQDYQPLDAEYVVVEVIRCSCDGMAYMTGTRLVVDSHMLRSFELGAETYFFIQENHIVGILG